MSGGLRRSMLRERERKSSGSKGWKGGYRDQLQIPKGEATPVLLTPGEYVDGRDDSGETRTYHTRPIHSVRLNEKEFRMWTCKSGWGGDVDEDILCFAVDQGDKRVSKQRAQFSLNCVHLIPHEQVPLKDKEGKTVRYEQGKNKGEIIKVWQPIQTPKGLREFKQNGAELIKRGEAVACRKKYIDVGSGHFDNLMGIEDHANGMCICGGLLAPAHFVCVSCEEPLLTADELDNMTSEDVKKFKDRRQKCSACGALDYPEPEYLCDACDAPRPLTAFDVVAYVRKTGEGTSSTISIEKVVRLEDFRLLDGTDLLEYEEIDGNLYPKLTDDRGYVFREDIAKLVTNQFDFDSIHQPPDQDYIAKYLSTRDVDYVRTFISRNASKDYRNSEKRFAREEPEEEAEEAEEAPPPRRAVSSRPAAPAAKKEAAAPAKRPANRR